MERLTQKSPVTDMVWFIDHENKDAFLEPCEMNSHHNRLAIQKLNEYERAEEQGLLLRLPCKVGDIVYTIYSVSPNRHVICQIDNVDKFFLMLSVSEERFGKTVFLTKEEAEQALKKMGEREDEN